MTQLIRLSLPILLASGVSAVNHLTDRYFLAQSGDCGLAAVLPAAMLASLLTVFASTSIGYVESFIAQHHGAGRRNEAVRAFGQALHLVIAALPIFLLACPLGIAILDWVGHPENVRAAEKTYFLFTQPAGLLTVLSTVLGALFTGQGKTRLVSACGILSALTNIVLDRILILGLPTICIFHFKLSISPMGIAGAGLATILANAVPCVLLAVAAVRDPIVAGNLRLLNPHLRLMHEILRFGLPSGLNALLGATAFTIFTLALGRLGEVELAASNTVFSFNNIFVLAETALAQAVTIAVARAYGGGGFPAVRSVVRSGLTLALAFTSLYLIALVPFMSSWLRLFATSGTDIDAFLDIGRTLILLLIVRNLADAVLTVYFGTLRGLGDTKFLVLVRTGADILVWIPVVFIVQSLHPTVTALWSTMPVGIGLSTLLLGLRLRNPNRIRTISPHPISRTP